MRNVITVILLILTSAAVFICPAARPARASQNSVAALSFAGKVQIPVPHTLRAVAVADFNQDGKQDLAAVRAPSQTVAGYVDLFLGNGDGGFGAPKSFPVGSDPTRAVAGDFNGDGKRDLVTIDRWSNTITILAGDGAGGFRQFSHPIGRDPYSIAAADFNGDGKQDLAVGLYHDYGKVEILTNNWGRGAALFTSGTTTIATGGPCFRSETASPPAVAQPTDIAVSDFNKDGRQDLVISGRNYVDHPGCASVLFGNGAGGVGSQTNLPVGSSPESVVAGDFNRDGNPDFAVGNSKFNAGLSNSVSVFLGDGKGGFGAATNVNSGIGALSYLAAADFDGDGIQDLAAAGYPLTVLPGDGKGAFGPPQYVDSWSGNLQHVAAGDFNGDGRPDLAAVVWSSGSASITVLINATTTAPARPLAQTPAAAEGNLYLRALSACVEKQAHEYKNLGGGRDYQNRTVEKDTFLTAKLPAQIGEYRIEYLDRNELTARYRKTRKPIPVLSVRPLVNEGGMLKIGIVDYWFSYAKRSTYFSLEGGCNVFFRYDCDQKVHVIEKVDLWGV